MASQRVLVSILNWNGGETILACLESVSRSVFHSFDIVVVDNASTDGSTEKIRSAFPSVTLVKNPDNRGFCGGQNQGLSLALEKGYDYVWMLNHDTCVETETLATLVAAMDAAQNVGMVSPLIADEGEAAPVQYCGTSIEWDEVSFRNWETLELALGAQESRPRAFFLWGTALLIRVSTLAKIGQLDERFFAYYEDYDLSLRVVRGGFLNRMVPTARIVHFARHDSSQRPPHHVYFNTRNRALFWSKHLERRRRIAFWREYLAGALIRASCFEEIGDAERMNATLLAIWDAMHGRGGPFDRKRTVAPWLTRLTMSHPYLVADVLRGNFMSIVKRRVGNQRRPPAE
jgi:GT2 family glycosyltransferase